MPLKIAAVETGIDSSMLGKVLPRLEPKVMYKEGWVVMPNFPKYQNLKSEDVRKGILREFQNSPENIQIFAKEGGWGEGLGMVGDTKPNLTKLTGGEIRISHEDEDKPKKTKANTDYLKVFELWGEYPLHWRKNVTEIGAAKNLLEESNLEDMKWFLGHYDKLKAMPYCPQILKPSDMDRKWDQLLAFKKKHG